VTRLVESKGLWRDLKVLEHIEKHLKKQNKTAVMYLLSTQVAQRSPGDISRMEESYNWPAAHMEGWPDMSGGEAEFYTLIQKFNASMQNIKVVFINQFGFCQELCGKKMPSDMEFLDIRKGCDVEFGQSIYEPFGIAHLESLTFGGICVVTNVCGCLGFARNTSNGNHMKNIIAADYTNTADKHYSDIDDILKIDKFSREQIEAEVSETVAKQIIERLPINESEIEDMLSSGYSLARNMSWDVVVKDYLLKSLQNSDQADNSSFALSNEYL